MFGLLRKYFLLFMAYCFPLVVALCSFVQNLLIFFLKLYLYCFPLVGALNSFVQNLVKHFFLL